MADERHLDMRGIAISRQRFDGSSPNLALTHNDPLNSTGRNEMLFAEKTRVRQRTIIFIAGIGGGKSFKVGGQEWVWGPCPSGVQGQSPCWRLGLRLRKGTTLFHGHMLFFHGFKDDSDICIHCLHVFNTKWKKIQFGDRKVVGQWASDGACPLGTKKWAELPNRLRRQWLRCTLAPPGKCDWIVRVRRRCGLLSNYFDPLFVLVVVTGWLERQVSEMFCDCPIE